MKLYLVRHGLSHPRPGTPSAGDAIGLSERGVAEARWAAEYLRNKDIVKVFTSPLTRASETAKTIAATLGVPLVIDERFQEFVPAELEGEKFCEARERARHDHAWFGEGGESFDQSIGRFTEGLRAIAESPIAVVSHELIIQNFLIQKNLVPPVIAYGSVSAVSWDSQLGIQKIDAVNTRPAALRRLLWRLKQ